MGDDICKGEKNMKSNIYPKKLKKGDEVRVIAPARSFDISFTDEMKNVAVQRLEAMGLRVSFGKYLYESDEFRSTTIEHRLEDLHEAFADTNVKGILAVGGGSTSNQLLKYLDYDLIQKNPKILCGLSDITALANAIYAKTGLVTYSGPQFTVFGASFETEYITKYFQKCLFSQEEFDVLASDFWCDQRFGVDKMKNDGMWVINEGEAYGKSLGGNLLTFKYLQGTPFAPDLEKSILFVEDNEKENHSAFQNQLQSLINQENFSGVKGLVIGRFQQGSHISRELLTKIIKTKRELTNMPVIANVDFGHSMPMMTFPIGGEVSLEAFGSEANIRIIKH
jgi:muramoyltetrapeptide carboxypeptidase LdcA involved in peptidoglycan recycling